MSFQIPGSRGSSIHLASEEHENASLRNLMCAWSIGFLAAIEGTISVPSLWPYLQSIGGTHHNYGLCIAIFAVGRMLSMGTFGVWVNKRPFKEVFVISLLISMFSGILYSMGPTLGVWSVIAGRGILGAMSSQTVASQTYVSKHTRPESRTKYMSINVLVQNVLTVAGPGFNLFIVLLPHGSFTCGSVNIVFNSFTWVGYFLFFGQLLVMIIILCFFTEPEPKPSVSAPRPNSRLMSITTCGDLFPWPRVFLDRWLHRTGAWVIMFFNFRNNFAMYGVTYAVPIIVARDYGFDQLQTSYIFLVLAIESILSTMLLGRLSKRCSDRLLILIWSMIAWSGLCAYVVFSEFGVKKISMYLLIICAVLYDFGDAMPPTQSLYSKLIGKQNVGIYFAVLQSNGSISRAVSGMLVGTAYGALGPPCLWSLFHCAFGASLLLFGATWRRFSPAYVEAMHARLDAEQLGHSVSMQRIETQS